MANKGFWRKERRIPGDSTIEGGYYGFKLLEFLHPPTATALVLGGAGGVYLGWKFASGHGGLAIVLAVVGGALLGALVGVIGYWLIRILSFIGGE